MALPTSTNTSSNYQPNKSYLLPFILVTSLFFFWGFVHNLDPVLIPHLRKTFQLTYVQSSLVDFSVFIAYFLMALPAGFVMRKFGFKAGIILGLSLFALGCFMFIPAANTNLYIFFLGALFIVACGLTFLETAANPYATILGDPATSTQRLNFAQSFNGLAVVLAPLVGGKIILSGTEYTKTQLDAMSATDLAIYLQSEADRVKMPYMILGIIILVIAVIFFITKLPDSKDDGKVGSGFSKILRFTHLRGAVIAQFFYVGAQVCVGSFFINVARSAVNMDEITASEYLSYGYGIAFVLGRFAGTFFMRFLTPQKLLSIYAIISVLLCILVAFATGIITVYAMIALSFFMSIMFPTIFALGIKDLNSTDTKMGSSLIIMAIVGGALLPLVLGQIADVTKSIQYGYIVPLACFAVVAWYGLSGSKVQQKA
ncbi:MAG: L-fucose:H+ symporter permease [Flavobacterium sp.]|nr:L-fucose:H+ symporter permease [Flavobacterium sp.]